MWLSQMLNYISTQFEEKNYKTAENSLNFIKKSINIKTNKNKYELYILEGKYPVDFTNLGMIQLALFDFVRSSIL